MRRKALVGILLACSVFLLLVGICVAQPDEMVYIFEDNDPDYSNPPFEDTLSIINASTHEITNTISGFNIGETIGGQRAIATYTDGTCIVAENVADRLSRWDAQGNCIFSIDMAIDAVDVSEEGYIYALTSSGTIYGKSTVILDGYGSIVKEAPFGGGDIVVDDKSNSVWIVGADIKRLNKDLTLQFSIDPIEWYAVSVDFDTNGDAWVAEREHLDESRSKNRLLKISPNGEIIQSIDLDSSPSCLSVDRKDDGIWVSTSEELYKFTSNGRKILEIDSGRGFSVKVDNSDRSAWLAGRGDVRHYTKDGTLISSISVFSANQAYAALQSWEPTHTPTLTPVTTMKSKNSGGTFSLYSTSRGRPISTYSWGLICSAVSSSSSPWRMEYIRWMVLMHTWLSGGTYLEFSRRTL